MKTNQNMVRKMGNFEVVQRTKDGMFNATILLKQWNEKLGVKKEVSKFFELKQTSEFIKVLEQEENLNTQETAYLKTRGKYGGTWMHPILFVKFAMWINPKFEYFVIKFVYDQLIKYRHQAGDNYGQLQKAAAKLKGVNYPQIAKGLNYIVFGKHESGVLRQQATEEQLEELTKLEEKLAFSIDMGYIKSYIQLLNEMRKIWHQKNKPF